MEDNDFENQNIQYTKPTNISSGRRRFRPPSVRTTIVSICAAAVMIPAGMIFNGLKDIAPDLPKINPNPGQELGETTFTDAEVSAFELHGVDAVGKAELTVDTIKQTLIDKRTKDENGKLSKVNPHETITWRKGKFGLRWENPGSWKPNKTDDGIEITLPPVIADGNVDVVKVPQFDKGASGRAAWQKVSGVFGASDTQAADFLDGVYKNAGEIETDKNIVGSHMRLTACGALASASQKAQATADALGVQATIERYTEPRKPLELASTKHVEPNGQGVRNIRFKIADPTKDGAFLDIKSCLDDLDKVSYNTKTLSTPDNPEFGLSPVSVRTRTLPAREQ